MTLSDNIKGHTLTRSVFMRTLIDIMHFLTPYRNLNHQNLIPNLNPKPKSNQISKTPKVLTFRKPFGEVRTMENVLTHCPKMSLLCQLNMFSRI